MRRKPHLKVNEGPFVSEYFEQQDIQAVGRTHALDVAPLRNELEDVEATHQVQNLAANESTGTIREVWRPDRQTAPSRRYSPTTRRVPGSFRAPPLSNVPKRGIWFHRPGDLQHARWMSKLIYV